jgi:hypothetical protein
MTEPVLEFVITAHAAFEMGRRQIDAETVRRVLQAPEQRQSVRTGRDILQSAIESSGKTYLVRIVVDIDRHPAEVVTAYRTSKLSK